MPCRAVVVDAGCSISTKSGKAELRPSPASPVRDKEQISTLGFAGRSRQTGLRIGSTHEPSSARQVARTDTSDGSPADQSARRILLNASLLRAGLCRIVIASARSSGLPARTPKLTERGTFDAVGMAEATLRLVGAAKRCSRPYSSLWRQTRSVAKCADDDIHLLRTMCMLDSADALRHPRRL